MQPVHFNWSVNNFSGWGLVGLNLFLQWANDPDIRPLMGTPITAQELAGIEPFKLIACRDAIQNSNRFQPELERAKAGSRRLPMLVVEGLGNGLYFEGGLFGSRTIGRCIFEDTRLEGLDEKLAKYDLLVCASQWNADLLRAHCRKPVSIVFEGIDPALFHPAPRSGVLDKNRFYVFSGGKVEFRKGHDLTLLAFREFSRRHNDAVLVTAWHSPWPHLSVGFRGRLEVALEQNSQGQLDFKTWLAKNGIDPARMIEMGPIPNTMMPALLREMDCALAPSRAEACTNLLAKEAMACGVPIIAAPNTGMKDLLTPDNVITLTRQQPVRDYALSGTEGWGEADVEEIVDALERLYTDAALGKKVGEAGARWLLDAERTWAHHAAHLKSLLLSL